jgi:hypothetical protein
MAATWDTTSLYRMADYSALEGRAVHNKANRIRKREGKIFRIDILDTEHQHLS